MPVVSDNQVRRPSPLQPLTAYRWFIEYGGRLGTQWVNDVTPRAAANTRTMAARAMRGICHVPNHVPGIGGRGDEKRRAYGGSLCIRETSRAEGVDRPRGRALWASVLSKRRVRSGIVRAGAFSGSSSRQPASITYDLDSAPCRHSPPRESPYRRVAGLRPLHPGVPPPVTMTSTLSANGANLPDLIRRTATYVDKILKGAKPANLPIEQPTTFAPRPSV